MRSKTLASPCRRSRRRRGRESRMAATSAGQVVELAKGEVRHTISRQFAPVLRVPPGTRVRIETELNIGDVLHRATDRFDASMVKLPYVNGATGPIAVEGATNRHVLVCDIEDMELVPP